MDIDLREQSRQGNHLMERRPSYLVGRGHHCRDQRQSRFISLASPGQINLQAPNDTATGTVPVVVTTATGSATSTVTLVQFAPSFCLIDPKHVAGIILRLATTQAHMAGGLTPTSAPAEIPLAIRPSRRRRAISLNCSASALGRQARLYQRVSCTRVLRRPTIR